MKPLNRRHFLKSASASGAGLTVVGMSTSLEPEALREAGAHHVARDFTDAGLLALVAATTRGG